MLAEAVGVAWWQASRVSEVIEVVRGEARRLAEFVEVVRREMRVMGRRRVRVVSGTGAAGEGRRQRVSVATGHAESPEPYRRVAEALKGRRRTDIFAHNSFERFINSMLR